MASWGPAGQIHNADTKNLPSECEPAKAEATSIRLAGPARTAGACVAGQALRAESTKILVDRCVMWFA